MAARVLPLRAGPQTATPYTRRTAIVMGLLVGVAYWLLSLPAVGLAVGLVAGLAAGVVTALWLGRSEIPLMLAPFYDRGPEVLAPSVWGRVPWRSRVLNARKRVIGELSTRSDEFRVRWAAHNAPIHTTGVKLIHPPAF